VVPSARSRTYLAAGVAVVAARARGVEGGRERQGEGRGGTEGTGGRDTLLRSPVERSAVGHCTDCGEDLLEVVESDTDARYNGDATVWECPSCGAVLGVTEVGV
jgi:predicted RNA-binding Zn-ribbon protein involved in translation (DUF1610 family)